jgi:hypothetical protein
MFSRKNLKKLLAGLVVILPCGILSAASAENVENRENYWVVGSYQNTTTFQQVTRKLETDLALSIRQQEVFVSGVLHHRLLVPETVMDAAILGRLNSMGITPWLMTLSESKPHSAAIEQYLVQVGSFHSIDEAMALERRLTSAGLGVSGEATLAAGKVVHHVWAGPSRDLNDVRQRLQKLGLAPGKARPVSIGEASVANRSAAPLRQVPIKAPVQITTQDSTAGKPQTQSSEGRYPQGFNLARLPAKRLQTLIID